MLYDKRIELVVKAGSLAYEARLIKRKAKAHKRLRREMQEHRIQVVRVEARATQLAIAFLRGRDFPEMNSRTQPNWYAVNKMVMRYGIYDRREDEEMTVEQAVEQQKLRYEQWRRPAQDAIAANIEAFEATASTRQQRRAERAASPRRTREEWLAMK